MRSTPMDRQTPNALTLDVEDYFHVHAFSAVIHRHEWEDIPRRVALGTRRFLDLCDKYQARATCFILGWVAEREPDLVREIADRGHEIASHGYWHSAVYSETEESFAEDLRRSCEAIRSAAPDAALLGYRAPSFSITPKENWAFDVLLQQGFRYDSSLFPVAMHDRYGYPTAPRTAHTLPNGMLEVPMSTLRVAGKNIPFAGGGYLRLYPARLTEWGIRSLNQDGIPAVVYLHPWELDPDQPRIASASLKSKFRHYVNLDKTHARLERLLQRFQFVPLGELFADRLTGPPAESPVRGR